MPVAVIVAAFVVLALGPGCAGVDNEGFRCSTEGRCPDGFVCVHPDDRCYRSIRSADARADTDPRIDTSAEAAASPDSTVENAGSADAPKADAVALDIVQEVSGLVVAGVDAAIPADTSVDAAGAIDAPWDATKVVDAPAERPTATDVRSDAFADTSDGPGKESDAPVVAEEAFQSYAHYGASMATGHFNDDLYPDLAIGVPGLRISVSTYNGGGVNVVYGTDKGLAPVDQGVWRLVDGNPSDYGAGETIVVGNFNHDAYDDVVFVAREIDVSRYYRLLHYCPGSSSGIVACEAARALPYRSDAAPPVLTAADFNRDGFDDLVVGMPADTVSGYNDAGTVIVFCGNATGIVTPTLAQAVTQDSIEPGTAAVGDAFGAALAVADFDNDSYPDLAIGSPGDTVGTISQAGAVYIVYGKPADRLGVLDTTRARVFYAGAGIPGPAETNASVGTALAAGNFGYEIEPAYSDLAIGAPGQPVDVQGKRVDSAGAIFILRGSATDLMESGVQTITRESGSIPGAAESNARFGQVLSAGDITGDGYADLVSSGRINRMEAVTVIRGGANGMNTLGSQFINHDTEGVAGVGDMCPTLSECKSYPGFAVADFDSNGHIDLAVGLPCKSFYDMDNRLFRSSGMVNVLLGIEGGLSVAEGIFYALSDSPSFLE